MTWTPLQTSRVLLLADCGFTVREIAFLTGLRRTQVAGKLHRIRRSS
ncbi:hypothetical protein SAMN06297251_10470 [Fulvimarina manganoxydans]|uniref:HTH luxR-type domain-containing protein n=1 Tax=Fulvimarina manganoxydans TaxID=937218 RepID=A0A1W2ACD7_9HYPH|nr:hypothetical protein SAMN06297251_10470 [Fulvimarina manganoxydans]